MRRRALIGITILLAAGLPVLAAPAEDEIRATEKEWAAAVAANDYAKIERLLAPKLIYAHSTGAVETKDQYMTRLRSGAQKYDGIEHEKTMVNVYGDTAVAFSHVRMFGKSNGNPFNDRLMMTHLWVKMDGRWQLAAHQTTKLQ
jgi:ketosteroid isomerase-like protein